MHLVTFDLCDTKEVGATSVFEKKAIFVCFSSKMVVLHIKLKGKKYRKVFKQTF